MNTATEIADVEVPTGEIPNEMDQFYLELGRDTVKRIVPALNDSLQRLVTLNATLLGGSLILLREDTTAGWARWGSIALFLVAMLWSFWGMLPFPAQFNLYSPDQIATEYRRAIAWKDSCVKTAAKAVLLGFLVAICGMLVGPGAAK